MAKDRKNLVDAAVAYISEGNKPVAQSTGQTLGDRLKLRDILNSSGVSYTDSDLNGGPVAQKTGTTLGESSFGVNFNNYTPSSAPASSGSGQRRLASDPYRNARYNSPYRQQLSEALAQYMGGSYDQWKEGAEYDGLRRDYERGGQRAMQDTLGQVAARTGGMASSYAGSVAQQAYGNYMAELEKAARDEYRNQRADDAQRLSLLMALENQDYGQWADEYARRYQLNRDEIGDARYTDETDYSRGRDADETAYNRGQDEKNWDYKYDVFNYGKEQDERDWQDKQDALAYEQQQDAVKWQMQAADLYADTLKKLGYIPPSVQAVINAMLSGGTQLPETTTVSDAVLGQYGLTPAGGNQRNYTPGYTPKPTPEYTPTPTPTPDPTPAPTTNTRSDGVTATRILTGINAGRYTGAQLADTIEKAHAAGRINDAEATRLLAAAGYKA